MGERPSVLWAHRPGPKARGWRSRGHPMARMSRTIGPRVRMVVRPSVTSTTAVPGRAFASWPVMALSASGGPTISHSSGPSHNAERLLPVITVLGSPGRETPSAVLTDSPGIRPRRVTLARNLSSAITRLAADVSFLSWAERPRWVSGLCRCQCSATQSGSFLVEEDGLHDTCPDDPVLEGDRDLLADPVMSPPDECQGDRTAAVGTHVA